jgi:hypothetical protein
VIAYESRVRHIDMVGLNDRFIARERKLEKLTAYLFERKPDIILQRDRADGSLITYGHGVLGDHTKWAEHPGWDHYAYAGSIIDMEPWRHELHVYVRREAPASLLTYVQRRVVDVVHAEPPVVYGSGRYLYRLSAGMPGRAGAAGRAAAAVRFPLAVSGDQRYLRDANGAPFLVQGDAAWSLLTKLSDDDVRAYFADRAGRGFNAAIVTLIDHAKGLEAKPDAAGQKPFLVPGDFATPNPAYFENARRRIAAARDAGFAVFLAPSYLGYGGGDEGFYAVMLKNGPDKLRGYGRYVGERFKDLDNVVWVEGGDYSPPPEGLRLVNAIAEGIREGGAHQLQTAHWSPETSASELATTGWLDLDSTYTYEPVYVKSARDHGADAGKWPHLLIESTYENEHDSTTEMLRAQAYTALLAGATGQFFGNNPIWKFEAGWQEALKSPGSRSMAQLAALFRQLPWWTLEPDDRALTFVSGLGPYGGRDRVVGARSADGRLAVAYIPGARQEKPIAVNLARLAGPARARFYDPERGVFQDSDENPVPNGGVRSFTAPESPPGRHAGDWVLVLEALSL